MIVLKNQFILSQAFKSSAIKSQYNSKTIAIITPTAIKCLRFIVLVPFFVTNKYGCHIYKEQYFKKNVLI